MNCDKIGQIVADIVNIMNRHSIQFYRNSRYDSVKMTIFRSSDNNDIIGT